MRAALLAIIAVGLLPRIYRLGHAELWGDEYCTYAFASQSLTRLWGPDIAVETNPPLYYTLQHWWLALGSSRFTLRLLPMLFGLCAIPLGFWLGRRLAGPRVGLVTAALIATSPVFIHYSREIRAYSLLFATVLAALGCLAQLLPDRFVTERAGPGPSPRLRPLLWIGYTVATTGALYAHNTGVLLPFLTSMLLAVAWLRGELTRSFVVAWLIANSIVLGAFAWWLPTMLTQTVQTLESFWVPESTPPWVRSQLLGVYPYQWWFKPVMLALAVVGICVLRCRPWLVGFLLVLVIGQPLLVYLMSLYRPIFIVRILVWPSLLLFVPIGAALAAPKSRRTFAIASVVVAAASLSTVVEAVAVEGGHGQYPSLPGRSALAAFLPEFERFDAAADVVVFAPMNAALEFQYVNRHSRIAIHGVGMTFADHREQVEPWYPVRWIHRDGLAARIRPFRRAWIVREVEPLVAVESSNGFDAVFARLGSMATVASRLRSGRFELVVYEMPE